MAMESVRGELAKFKEESAKEARKAKIEREVAKYSNKATQRAVKHGMEALNLLEDVDNTWAPLAEEAVDGVVITADNIPKANKALDAMTTTIKTLRDHIQWEVDMQIVAADSPFKWSTVHQMELSKKGEKAVCSLKEEEIRKHEKERMSWEKDLKASKAGAAKVITPKRKKVPTKDDGATPPAKKTKVDKINKGKCWRCGQTGHIVKDCDKDYSK